MSSSIIAEFVASYRRQESYYAELSRAAARLLQRDLESEGLRALVTDRAKDVDRLHTKLIEREAKKQYESTEEIRADIRDLAGVRVALYFPDDESAIHSIIERLFDVRSDSQLPKSDTNSYGRFPGYCARHYTVKLLGENAGLLERRYLGDLIEVQVATVFMHAWAEVEHDLRYKPVLGDLDVEELLILEQLNGLALTAEAGLKALRAAITRRTSSTQAVIRNNFDLASLLNDLVLNDPAREAGTPNALPIGRADILYHFLRETGNLSVPFVRALYDRSMVMRTRNRSIVDPLIDQLLEEKIGNIAAFERALEAAGPLSPYDPVVDKDTADYAGQFLTKWEAAGLALRALIPENKPAHKSANLVEVRDALKRILSADAREEARTLLEQLDHLDSIRRIRNDYVHRGRLVRRAVLADASKQIDALLTSAMPLLQADWRSEVERRLNSGSNGSP